MSKRRGVVHNAWLNSPAIEEWRQRLRLQYRRVTLEYLRLTDPTVKFSPSGPLEERNKRMALSLGRSGLEYGTPHAQKSTHLAIQRLQNEQRRTQYLEALDGLLTTHSRRSISVAKLVKTAGGSNDNFYSIFPSGTDSLFCYWAAHELDKLTKQIKGLFDIVKNDKERSVRNALHQWMEQVSTFIMARPNGRMQIPLFLVHELDKVGAARVEELRAVENDDTQERRLKAVEDLVVHAAAFHRAGARSIYELQQLFLADEVWVKAPQAMKLWPDRENCSWNLALSFWQAMFTCLFAVGVLDAERDAAKHRELILDIWYRGAFPRSRGRDPHDEEMGSARQ